MECWRIQIKFTFDRQGRVKHTVHNRRPFLLLIRTHCAQYAQLCQRPFYSFARKDSIPALAQFLPLKPTYDPGQRKVTKDRGTN
jgi:hypothetical protein